MDTRRTGYAKPPEIDTSRTSEVINVRREPATMVSNQKLNPIIQPHEPTMDSQLPHVVASLVIPSNDNSQHWGGHFSSIVSSDIRLSMRYQK